MPVPSRLTYTPEQRRILDTGLRMLARLIAQAYLREACGAAVSPSANRIHAPGAADPSHRKSADKSGAAD